MTYRLLIRPDAELDIQAAFEWYETHASGLGSEFVRAVDVCLSGLGRNPLAYPLVYRQARLRKAAAFFLQHYRCTRPTEHCCGCLLSQ